MWARGETKRVQAPFSAVPGGRHKGRRTLPALLPAAGRVPSNHRPLPAARGPRHALCSCAAEEASGLIQRLHC